MKEIEFKDITIKPGFINFNFEERDGNKTKTDSVYIEFDKFVPSQDIVAIVLSSFCGSSYDRVSMDLEIYEDTYNNLKTYLKADFIVRKIINEHYLKKQIKIGEQKTALNFSGGLDSLALLCCFPQSVNLISIYFDGFEREYQYFKKFSPVCIKTDVRRKINIDKNSWEFMGFGSVLYKEYLGLEFITFGNIAESWVGNLQRQKSAVVENNLIFNSAALRLPHCAHALTEIGTTLLVAKYMPEELDSSLKSLANIGSEKLYRKECLVNIACLFLGINPIIKEYHYPKQKMKFGQYFLTDFVSIAIAKFLGIQFASRIYVDLPWDFEKFINEHSLKFYLKVKQDNLTLYPEQLMAFFKGKLESAGLEYYVEDDYLELGEVVVYIQNKTIQKLQNELVQEREYNGKQQEKVLQPMKQLEAEKQKYSQLKKRNEETERELVKIKKQAETALRELNNVKSGWSFRTGRIITFFPRKIRDWLK